MAQHTPSRVQRGFTLAELLVTLSVSMILGIGTAEFAPRIIQDSRMVTAVNEFVGILQRARSQAIKRGRRVVLCPTRDTVNCGHSLDWQTGWLLFESDNREREADEPLLRIGQPPGDGIYMYASNSRKRIVYQPTGTSGGSNSTFTFCDRNNHTKPRVICLSNTGRPRVSRTRCDGKPIICP